MNDVFDIFKFNVDNEREIAKAPIVDFSSPLTKPPAEASGTTK